MAKVSNKETSSKSLFEFEDVNNKDNKKITKSKPLKEETKKKSSIKKKKENDTTNNKSNNNSISNSIDNSTPKKKQKDNRETNRKSTNPAKISNKSKQQDNGGKQSKTNVKKRSAKTIKEQPTTINKSKTNVSKDKVKVGRKDRKHNWWEGCNYVWVDGIDHWVARTAFRNEAGVEPKYTLNNYIQGLDSYWVMNCYKPKKK